MIKALLLDFNGVIIDDEPIHFEAYKEILALEDIDLSEEKYLGCLGMNDRAFLEAIYEREGKDHPGERAEEILKEKSAAWQKAVSEVIPFFGGIPDFIHRMASEFSLGLVSMARRQEIDYVLDNSGLRDCFSAIVSADDVPTYKPDPACYKIGFKLVDEARLASGKLPLSRSECVVIEDSPPGILAAKAAGIRSLGIANTVSAEELRSAGALSVTKDLADWSPESFRQVFN